MNMKTAKLTRRVVGLAMTAYTVYIVDGSNRDTVADMFGSIAVCAANFADSERVSSVYALCTRSTRKL